MLEEMQYLHYLSVVRMALLSRLFSLSALLLSMFTVKYCVPLGDVMVLISYRPWVLIMTIAGDVVLAVVPCCLKVDTNCPVCISQPEVGRAGV